MCKLRWDWEIEVPELCTSVFLLPGTLVKNADERLAVLNRIAKSVIDSQRGKHPFRVFRFRGRPITKIYNSGWKRARVAAAKAYARENGEPVS